MSHFTDRELRRKQIGPSNVFKKDDDIAAKGFRIHIIVREKLGKGFFHVLTALQRQPDVTGYWIEGKNLFGPCIQEESFLPEVLKNDAFPQFEFLAGNHVVACVF